MSSRSGHVDVNERRLRPIYDCLDGGNNKKAVQEADRLLKKQKDFPCAKALRCLALIRLGRQDETFSTLQEVHALHPNDEHTLQAMAMCYRDMCRLDLLADMYENAHKSKPDSEEILNSLFMAYVRLGMCKKQQQVAMQLHKLRPQKNPYYFWAVMSIVMQAHGDKQLGSVMYLPLAEKMTLKYIQEGKLEAEAEVRLYLIILECMNKHKEMLEVLKGPLAAKLTSEPEFPKFLKGELLAKLERWHQVNAHYRKLLLDEPDHWLCYKEYFASAFRLIESNWSHSSAEDHGEEDLGPVDCTVDLVVEFIKFVGMMVDDKMMSGDSSLRRLRGPYLAQLELMRLLKERHDNRWSTVFGNSPTEQLRRYIAEFGDKTCCFVDLQPYTDLLSVDEQQKLFDELLDGLALGSSKDGADFVSAEDARSIQRHLTMLQLMRSVGMHYQMSASQRLEFVTELGRHYDAGLQLGKDLLSTDLQYVDCYILLMVHTVYDLYIETAEEQFVWRAIVLLEKAVSKSPSNFQFKLFLIQLYSTLGVFGPCLTAYEKMDVKHIQHDSLGYLVTSQVLRFGHFSKAETLLDTVLRFFASVDKETSDYLISSYKYGSFPKVHEFVKFKERLQNSLQFASSTVEKLLLDLTRPTSHKATQEVASAMDVDPLMETTDFEAVRDNRDCGLMLSWNPPHRTFTEAMRESSFMEEKAWLRVRNLTARCLVVAGRVPAADARQASLHHADGGDSVNNGETSVGRCPLMDAVKQLGNELKTVLNEFSSKYADQPINETRLLVAPARTRLVPYLRLGLGEVLVQVLSFLSRLAPVRDYTLNEQIENVTDLPCTSDVDKLCDTVVEGGRRLRTSVESTSKLVDVDALENLVLVADHVCHVTVVLGACQVILKPVKLAASRRGKKRKELDPRTSALCQCFSELLAHVTGLTGKLLDVFEQFGTCCDGDFVAQFSALALDAVDDSSAAQHLNSCAKDTIEESVMDRVQASYQQTASEMSRLLKDKLKYLEALQL